MECKVHNYYFIQKLMEEKKKAQTARKLEKHLAGFETIAEI